MVDTLLNFSLLVLANIVGSSIAILLFLPYIRKEMRHNLGRTIGRDFARGIDEHYKKNEENIKRKPV